MPYHKRNFVIDAAWDRQIDLFILDRGLYDASLWMEYWLQKGQLTKAKASAYRDFFSDPKWLAKIDICFFIICDPQEAIRRNEEAIPLDEFGETTNPESIKSLVNITRKIYDYWRSKGAPVVLIDTTSKTPKEIASDILDITLEMLERRFNII